MGRLLSALLILVAVLSHGAMGAAAPHFEHDDHFAAIAHHHAGQAIDADDHETSMASSEDQGTQKSAPASGHHSHVSFDVAPNQIATLTERVFIKERQLPLDDAWRSSAIVAPLTEPPSA